LQDIEGSSSNSPDNNRQISEAIRHPLLLALDALDGIGWTMSEIRVRHRAIHGGQVIKLTTKFDLAVFKCIGGECTLVSGALDWTKSYPKTDDYEELDAIRWRALRIGTEKYVRKWELPPCGVLRVRWVSEDYLEPKSVYVVTISPRPGLCGGDVYYRSYDLEPSFTLVDEWYNTR
jgi:hypothetical protein